MPTYKTQRWSPNTCGCSINQKVDVDTHEVTYVTFEDSVELQTLQRAAYVQELRDQGRGKDASRIAAKKLNSLPEVACSAHAGLAGVTGLYEVCDDENKRWNITFGMVRGNNPALVVSDYVWSFDAGRKLHASFPSLQLAPLLKSDLQAALDIRFGPDKVVVE